MKNEKLQALLDFTNDIIETQWTIDDIRNYSAPKEIVEYYKGSLYDEKVIKNLLIELLEELTYSDLIDIYHNYNSYDGSFEFMQFYKNDEYFFEEFFNNPMEAVRATFYGDYRYMDDYVKFNGYGNLQSFNEYELEEATREYIGELADYILDYRRKSYNDIIDQFIDLLEEVEREDEE